MSNDSVKLPLPLEFGDAIHTAPLAVDVDALTYHRHRGGVGEERTAAQLLAAHVLPGITFPAGWRDPPEPTLLQRVFAFGRRVRGALGFTAPYPLTVTPLLIGRRRAWQLRFAEDSELPLLVFPSGLRYQCVRPGEASAPIRGPRTASRDFSPSQE